MRVTQNDVCPFSANTWPGTMTHLLGIDVAFEKGKRLPVVVCAFRGSRFEP
jgi:hypothetical protein